MTSGELKHQPLLFDCDPGIDDAFALMCAFKYANVATITTVSGNVSLANTTRNARYLVELANRSVPIHRGAKGPLHVERELADDIHGQSGLGLIDVGEPDIVEHPTDATTAIVDHCASDGAVIIATGPLTNIAHALQADPSIADRIGHLYWMGGSTKGGNVTDRAEFNAWADPHAADITLRSSIPLTMFGLNLTHQVRLGKPAIDHLTHAGTTTARLFADLLRFYWDHGRQDPAGQPVHDACALLGFTHPALFDTIEANIVAHTTNDERRGMTETTSTSDSTATHRVARAADRARVIELILEAAIDPSLEVGAAVNE